MFEAQPSGFVLVLLLSSLTLAGCKPAAQSVKDPRLSERVVAVDSVEPIEPTYASYTGIVGAKVESDLGFRVAGKVTERLVDTGQTVTRGQALMRMDPTDYTHALTAQAGSVAAARARFIQAAADERRYRGLVATGAVSRSAYDQIKAAADSAKALLDAALAQEDVAKNQQDYAVLVADADGTVVETLAEPGQVVGAGDVVVRLAHAGPREAVVNLPEMVRPAIGSEVRASLYGGKVAISARLRQLSDAADKATRTFEARYVMDGAGAAAPLGATVTIALGDERPSGAWSVPLGAIDDRGQGPGIWIVDPGTNEVAFEQVEVRTLGGERVSVRGDLASGQTVVAAGGHYLQAGQKVRPTVIKAAMQ